MNGGKIIAAGKTKAIFENPPNTAAARLTGCKNISKAQVLGENEIYAEAWGCRLRVQGSLDGVTHVGIRAHDLVPVPAGSEYGFNEVRPAFIQKSSDPFENSVIFTNANANTKPNLESAQIWWKYSKYMPPKTPDKLFFPPESLLLLRG